MIQEITAPQTAITSPTMDLNDSQGKRTPTLFMRHVAEIATRYGITIPTPSVAQDGSCAATTADGYRIVVDAQGGGDHKGEVGCVSVHHVGAYREHLNAGYFVSADAVVTTIIGHMTTPTAPAYPRDTYILPVYSTATFLGRQSGWWYDVDLYYDVLSQTFTAVHSETMIESCGMETPDDGQCARNWHCFGSQFESHPLAEAYRRALRRGLLGPALG